MKPPAIHAEAEAEVGEAIAYYEAQRAGLGREFREDLEDAFTRIRQGPGVHAPIDEQGTRKLRFRRFPYTIYYVELEGSIWIAAVAHQKRRPGYWTGRRL
ncbi:MAG: type II toxin-antitoxin system RelE/ParE family toxin [Planctomycetaceae bacterium]|nr:type II toxin-antitoxin system RelE/ParE family toxin [Planctomycetaceae bacterium]